MRYSKSHKEETRRKLLDSSRALVKKGGFDSTGVEALMSSIGLTPGAFYTHFASKQALLEEVLREELQHSVALFETDACADGDRGRDLDVLRQRLRAYLSSAHALHPEAGCVLAAMGAELGRTSPEAKAIIETGLKALRDVAQATLADRDRTWAVISQCVGAVILSRAVASDALRGEILRGNRASLDALLDSLVGSD